MSRDYLEATENLIKEGYDQGGRFVDQLELKIAREGTNVAIKLIEDYRNSFLKITDAMMNSLNIPQQNRGGQI